MSMADPFAPAVWTLIRFYRTGALWWAGVVAVGFLLIGLGIHIWGEPDRSIWAYTGEPVRWVTFVMGLLVVPGLFRAMVAHGVTRRTFAIASGIAIGMFAVAVALYAVVGFLVERALYAAADTPTTVEAPHLFDSSGQLHLIFAEYALATAVYLVAGWLIGVGFQRHWLIGVASILVAGLSVTVVEQTVGTGAHGPWRPGELDLGLADLPLGFALPLAVGVILAGLLAGRWLLHRTPIKASRS
jgi:hypothetical protein